MEAFKTSAHPSWETPDMDTNALEDCPVAELQHNNLALKT